MNTVSKSVNSCAICLNEPIEGTREELSYSFLPAFIQRYLNRRTVLTLKPCGHKFHLACIRQWANESSGCPLDRRLIRGSSHPALLPINLQKRLLKSVEKNRIGEVQEILLAGLTPEQFSCRKLMNPLTMALKNDHWEIAALLLRVGWRTEDNGALNNLGWMYQRGLGVKQDYTRAMFWHLRAAEKGDSTAQNNIGWMYRNGLGVKQDFTTAIFWYRKAANQKNASAQNNLGWMYSNGLGVKLDHTMAIFWYQKAAEQGLAAALVNLNTLHLNSRA